MSIYRSYFQKSNTLIEGNQTNNSQNPVTEISYGTPQALKTRYLFKVDFSDLFNKITNDGISKQAIVSHKLCLRNTIAQAPTLIGKKSYLDTVDRASSVVVQLFTISEDWDEGSGYEFVYRDQNIIDYGVITGSSNWYHKKTGQAWTVPGAYISTGTTGLTGTTTGTSMIITSQTFQKGNEDIMMDVTSYVNWILFSGGTDHGFGLKMNDAIEALTTQYRKAIGFHTNHTNTVFEPYIETTINDYIGDDRKFFFMDKTNELYLYSSAGDVAISAVTITDYQGLVITTLSGNSITRVKKGVYKISYSVSSDTYPDAVIFNDNWYLIQNGKYRNVSQDFYLIGHEKYYNFDLSNVINPDNYHFSYSGIKSGEYIRRGDMRRVFVDVKQLYHIQDDNLPLSLEYRLYMKQGDRTHIDIIPFSKVNRTSRGYEFDIDTTWLIPHDYVLELKLSNNSLYATKSPIKFTIVNDDGFAS